MHTYNASFFTMCKIVRNKWLMVRDNGRRVTREKNILGQYPQTKAPKAPSGVKYRKECLLPSQLGVWKAY